MTGTMHSYLQQDENLALGLTENTIACWLKQLRRGKVVEIRLES